MASQLALKKGVLAYNTLGIYDLKKSDEYSFQIIEKLPRIAVKNYLNSNSNKENEILIEVGKAITKLQKRISN